MLTKGVYEGQQNDDSCWLGCLEVEPTDISQTNLLNESLMIQSNEIVKPQAISL